MSNRKIFRGTQKRVRIIHSKRAIRVWAIEFLLHVVRFTRLNQRSLGERSWNYSSVKYILLSLSRTRLSRITAYLEVKIWSLSKHENLTTGKNYCEKEEQFLLFSTIFSIYARIYFQKCNYTYICQMWLFGLFFSSILQIWYVEVRISRSISESPLEFEITRVDCIVNDIIKCKKRTFYCIPLLANLHPKSFGTRLTSYHARPKFYQPTGKQLHDERQCRQCSYIAFCGIWSVSSLFLKPVKARPSHYLGKTRFFYTKTLVLLNLRWSDARYLHSSHFSHTHNKPL